LNRYFNSAPSIHWALIRPHFDVALPAVALIEYADNAPDASFPEPVDQIRSDRRIGVAIHSPAHHLAPHAARNRSIPLRASASSESTAERLYWPPIGRTVLLIAIRVVRIWLFDRHVDTAARWEIAHDSRSFRDSPKCWRRCVPRPAGLHWSDRSQIVVIAARHLRQLVSVSLRRASAKRSRHAVHSFSLSGSTVQRV